MNKSINKVRGIQYPLIKHPQGFFHHAHSDINQIKSDMATIILTEPGERLFVPHFGTGLSKINLNSPIEMVRAEARIKIATSLKKWEKRVQVHDIIVDYNKNEENSKVILSINILFIDPMNIKNIESLMICKAVGGNNIPF